MYKKYDQKIKDIIIQTKNINAFPELNIPRTTALYWIKQSKNTIRIGNSLDNIYEREINHLRKSIEGHKVMAIFLKEVCTLYSQEIESKRMKRKIAAIIHKHKTFNNIENMCSQIKYNSKSYYQYYSESHNLKFKQYRPNQLTASEQKLLIKIAKNKKLSHLSIKQLQLHAFQSEGLHCHYDTWRKYINNYHIKRSLYKNKRTMPHQQNSTV